MMKYYSNLNFNGQCLLGLLKYSPGADNFCPGAGPLTTSEKVPGGLPGGMSVLGTDRYIIENLQGVPKSAPLLN